LLSIQIVPKKQKVVQEAYAVKALPFRHVMANVLWSDNGWTTIDPTQPGKSQFRWTEEHPDDHADALLFNWSELVEYGGYVPLNVNPREYVDDHNGAGFLFVASKNPRDGRYYIVGFFSECEFDLESVGWFTSNFELSARFAVPVPLDIQRHCPLLKSGAPRRKTFGQNNFNYLRNDWARTILEDALVANRGADDFDSAGCSLRGDPPATIIQKALDLYFNKPWTPDEA